MPTNRQEMNRTGEQSRESSLGRERSSPHPSATGEWHSGPPLTTARLENGGEGQAPSPSKQQKGNSIPLSVMVNISSYMEPESSGMIPMNVLGFLWEAAKEAKRRDEIVTLPIALLSNVVDFIPDRRTYNAVALANKELYQICKTNKEKPWPTIRCRPDSDGDVLCYFSKDSQWIYQLRDSKIRCWNLDSGPSKRPLKITNFYNKYIYAELGYLAAYHAIGAVVKVYELGGGSLTTPRSFLLFPDSDLEDREDMGVYKVIDIEFSTSNDACVIQCQIFNDDVGEIISSESTFCVYDLQSRSLVRTLGNALVYDYDDSGLRLIMTKNYILWKTISDDESHETTLQLWEYNKSDHWIDLRVTTCHDGALGFMCVHPKNDRFLTYLFDQEDPNDSTKKLLRLVLLELLAAENHGTIESFRCTEISMEEFPFSFYEIEFTTHCFGDWFPDGKYQFYINSSMNPNAIILRFDEGSRSLSVVEPYEQSFYHRRFCQLVSDFTEEVRGTGSLDDIDLWEGGRTMMMKSSCGLIKTCYI